MEQCCALIGPLMAADTYRRDDDTLRQKTHSHSTWHFAGNLKGLASERGYGTPGTHVGNAYCGLREQKSDVVDAGVAADRVSCCSNNGAESIKLRRPADRYPLQSPG